MNILQRVQAAKSEAAALGHEMKPFVYQRTVFKGVVAASSCKGCGAEVAVVVDYDEYLGDALVHPCLNPKQDAPPRWKTEGHYVLPAIEVGPAPFDHYPQGNFDPFQGLPGMNGAPHPHGIAPLSTTREGIR